MAIKMYQAHVINADCRLHKAFERTHYVFVHCLRQMIDLYLSMRKGKHGLECIKLVDTILNHSNQFAHGVMDQLTRISCTSSLKAEWVTLAKERHRKNGPLFLQHEGFAKVDGIVIHTKSKHKQQPQYGKLAVPAKFWHQVCDSASAVLRSNQRLMDKWRTERSEWMKRKNEWELDHPEFMSFWNGMYTEFESVCNRKRKRIQKGVPNDRGGKKQCNRIFNKKYGHWQQWYEWILSHPEIIEWRGKVKASEFKTVPEDLQAKIKMRHPQPHKYISIFLNWLKKNNPELAILSELRRLFIQEFLIFKRPPTLTLPDLHRHPYYFTMEQDIFYKRVDFERGCLQLQLIDETEDGAWFFNWIDVQLKCDPRLIPSFRAKEFVAHGRYPPYIDGKVGYSLNHPAETPEDRKAGYAGARLTIKDNRKELFFRVIEQDCPPRICWKRTEVYKCPADKAFSPEGERIPLKVMAVDLGIRNIGAYAIAQGQKHEEGWLIEWHKKGIIDSQNIPELRTIRAIDFQLRDKKSRHGRVAKGVRSFIELQEHQTNMADDRFKKGANRIIELALMHNIRLVLFEKLDPLFPRALDEHWMNNRLHAINHRQIVKMVSHKIIEFGIDCKDDISPWLISHICSKCHKPGWRFSMKTKQLFGEDKPEIQSVDYGYPIWDHGGHLFRCPHCAYSVNSRINAAGNIANKFFGIGLWASLQRSQWIYSWDDGDSFDAKKTFAAWAEGVKRQKTRGEAFGNPALEIN